MTHDSEAVTKLAQAQSNFPNEADYRLLSDINPVGIFQDDRDGQCIYANAKALQLAGLSLEQYLGNGWVRGLHPDDRDRVEAQWFSFVQQALSDPSATYNLECRLQHADASVVWVWAQAVAQRNSAGEIIGYIGTLTDITERKQVELEKQQLQEQMQFLLAKNPAVVFSCAAEPNYGGIFVSENIQAVLGYKQSEFIDKPDFWASQIHPEDAPQVFANLSHLFEQGYHSHEYRWLHQDGTYRWIRSDLKLMRDRNGQPTEIVGYLVDISDRKAQEEQLQQAHIQLQQQTEALERANHNLQEILEEIQIQQEELHCKHEQLLLAQQLSQQAQHHYQALFDFAPDGYLVTDAVGTIQEANRAASQLLQQKAVHLIGKPLVTIITQDEQPNFCRWLLKLPESSSPETQEFTFQVKQQALPVSVSVAPSLDFHSQAIGYRWLLRDMTAHKQSESELQTAKVAAEAANQAKSCFLANMSHELRTPLNAILGFSQLLTHHPSLLPEQQEQIAIIHRSGEHLLSLINDVLDMSKIEAGQTTTTVNEFDPFELMATLEQLFSNRAQRKGLQLQIALDATVPHYIQTDERKLRQVLINLIGNAIKFTQHGSVSVGVGKRGSDIRHRGSDMASGVDQSNSALPPSYPPTLSPSHLTPNPQSLIFQISDTGPGIDPDELESIFEPFFQSKTYLSSQEGTGLGLSMSQQLVRLLGGKLTVSSRLGQGATFQFEIPVEIIDPATIAPSAPIQRVIGLAPDQPTYRILVVEDHWANRHLLISLLHPLGFEVKEAANGQAALPLWETWHPHLIWMDIRMPGMDGLEATRYIREKERVRGREREQAKASDDGSLPSHSPTLPLSHSSTTIIALTASAQETNQTELSEAGFDDFVDKPLKEEKILNTMTKHLGVQYLYQEQQPLEEIGDRGQATRPNSPPTNPHPEPYNLQAASFQVMPQNWVKRLHQASIQLNPRQLLILVEQIPAEHADLAQALREKVSNFDFEQVMELTEMALREGKIGDGD